MYSGLHLLLPLTLTRLCVYVRHDICTGTRINWMHGLTVITRVADGVRHGGLKPDYITNEWTAISWVCSIIMYVHSLLCIWKAQYPIQYLSNTAWVWVEPLRNELVLFLFAVLCHCCVMLHVRKLLPCIMSAQVVLVLNGCWNKNAKFVFQYMIWNDKKIQCADCSAPLCLVVVSKHSAIITTMAFTAQ